jgi:hypothetical protein
MKLKEQRLVPAFLLHLKAIMNPGEQQLNSQKKQKTKAGSLL